MKKLGYIIENGNEEKTCEDCGSKLWYLTRGQRKYDYSPDKKEYTRLSYYIYTCGGCGKRTDHTTGESRCRVYSSFDAYHDYLTA